MTKILETTKETVEHLHNRDYALALRRIIDCVMMTDNISLFPLVIEITELYYDKNIEAFENKARLLIEKINNLNISHPIKNSQKAITAVGIKKSYGSGSFALGPINLEIYKGTVTGLVGENGNGKTTLLRILAKELYYNEGQLEYNFNQRIPNDYYLRTKLAYIPQRPEKWYGSLMDNLKFALVHYGTPPEEIELRVLVMVARLGLWKYKKLKWAELSSGYKMRFELARTLLRKPEVLILDEPLANLDILSQQIILEDIKYIATSPSNPIAVILSSQQLYEVEKISDKVIFLKNGAQTDLSKEILDSNKLIVEIDTTASREEITSMLNNKIEEIQYNGGTYMITFREEMTFSQLLSLIANSNLEITYIRNITHSTRKYFVR